MTTATRSSGEADQEVFLYDAEADRLVCASCDPSGARPRGRRGFESAGGTAGLAPAYDPQGLWAEQPEAAARPLAVTLPEATRTESARRLPLSPPGDPRQRPPVLQRRRLAGRRRLQRQLGRLPVRAHGNRRLRPLLGRRRHRPLRRRLRLADLLGHRRRRIGLRRRERRRRKRRLLLDERPTLGHRRRRRHRRL